MPRYDGTGPQGQGPMSGRGEGHCAIKLSESGQAPVGYAGIQGAPVSPDSLSTLLGSINRFARWMQPVRWLGCAFRRGRGPGRLGSRRSERR